jgi:hypothetical protein
MMGISRLGKQLLVSAVGFCSMELDKPNRSLKVAVQGLDFMAHPLYMELDERTLIE